MSAGVALITIALVSAAPRISDTLDRQETITLVEQVSSRVGLYASINCGSLPNERTVEQIYAALGLTVPPDANDWLVIFNEGAPYFRVTDSDPSPAIVRVAINRYQAVENGTTWEFLVPEPNTRLAPRNQVTKQLLLEHQSC